MPPSRHRRTQGFTIVEVMMASVILVVAFFGMIQAITVGSEMMATARRQTIANQIITHEIEKLRLQTWTSITGYSTVSGTYTSDSADLNTEIAGSGVTFTLASAISTPVTDMREITFTVTWTKSGTNNAAVSTAGSLLQQLSFSNQSPIARTYTRVGVAYFTKYGLNLSTQRS